MAKDNVTKVGIDATDSVGGAKLYNKMLGTMGVAMRKQVKELAAVKGITDKLIMSAEGFNKAGEKVTATYKVMNNRAYILGATLEKLIGTEKRLTQTTTQVGATQTRVATQTQSASNKKKDAIDKVAKSYDHLSFTMKTAVRIFEFLVVRRMLHALVTKTREAITTIEDLHKAITEIRTIAQDNQAVMSSWADSLYDVSNAWDLDLLDTANAAYEVLSNQIAKGRIEVEQFMESAAVFGKVTKSELTDSVNLLTAALNAYGKTAAEVDDISAIFFKTIELGRIRASDLANTMGRALVPAAQLGIELEELSAMMATITIKGVKATEAMTLIRGVMMKLMKPTGDMIDLFDKWGIKTGEQAIATFRLHGIMQKFEEASKGSASVIARYFGRIRATMGVTSVIADLEKFNETYDAIKNAAKESYIEAVGMQFESAGERVSREFTRLQNHFTRTFGESAVQMIDNYTTNIASLVTTVQVLTTTLFYTAQVALTIWSIKRIQIYSAALTVVILKTAVLKKVTTATAIKMLMLNAIKLNAWKVGIAAAIAGLTIIIKVAGDAAKAMERISEEYDRIQASQKSVVEQQKESLAVVMEDYLSTVIELRQEYAGVAAAGSAAITIFEEMIEADQAWLDKHQDNITDDVMNTVDKYTDMYDALIDLKADYQKEIDKLEKEQSKKSLSIEKTLEDWTRKTLKPKAVIERIEEQIRAEKARGETAKAGSEVAITAHEAEEQAIKDLIKFELQAVKARASKAEKGARRMGGGRISIDTSAAEKKIIQKGIDALADLKSRYDETYTAAIDQQKEYIDSTIKNIELLEGKINDFITKVNELFKTLSKDELATLGGKSLDEMMKSIVESGGMIKFDTGDLTTQMQMIIDKFERVAPIEEAIESLKADSEALDRLTDALTVQTKVLRQQMTEYRETKAAADKAITGNLVQFSERLSDAMKSLKYISFERGFGYAAAQVRPPESQMGEVLDLFKGMTKLFKGVDIEKLTSEEQYEIIEHLNRSREEAETLADTLSAAQGYTQTYQDQINESFVVLDELATKFTEAMIKRKEAEEQTPIVEKRIAELSERLLTIRDLGTEWNDHMMTLLTTIKEKGTLALEAEVKVREQFRLSITAFTAVINQSLRDLAARPLTQPKAAGGSVWGTDTVPTRLTPGEFVINQRSSRKFYGQLLAMNNGGGAIGGDYSTTVGDLSVTVQGGDTSRQTAHGIISEIRREIHRGKISGI